jgi:hypothetical protein
MALIRHFEPKAMDRNSIHDQIDATYTSFHRDGRSFVQIGSYGRREREIPWKKSQTIQLSEESARQLYEFLKTEFQFK